MALISKRKEAEEIAEILIDAEEVGMSMESIRKWPDHDLYEWIETWGYTWNEKVGWISAAYDDE